MSLHHPRKAKSESNSGPSAYRITSNPKIMLGKPVIKGTRIAVEFVINLLAKGWSSKEILENYPQLTAGDIQACLDYAGRVIQSEKIYPLKSRRETSGR